LETDNTHGRLTAVGAELNLNFMQSVQLVTRCQFDCFYCW